MTGLVPEEQIIWTSGDSLCMHEDIANDLTILGRLARIIEEQSDTHFVFIPYTSTFFFQQWFSLFQDHPRVRAFVDNEEWKAMFGTKAILHRHIKDLHTPSMIETIDPTIPVAQGFVCSDVVDLVAAFRLLGCEEVILKPCIATSGVGILFTCSIQELESYTFPHGEVVMEEKLSIDTVYRSGMEEEISPAVHYMGGNIIGNFLVDQVLNGVIYSGNQPSSLLEDQQNEVLTHTQVLINAINPGGAGGFDFLMSNGVAILSDINVGRFNGSLVPKIFFASYFANQPTLRWVYWISPKPIDLTISSIWSSFMDDGLALSIRDDGSTSSGVFPIHHIKGVNSSFIAIAESSEDVLSLRERVLTLFEGL